MSRHITAGCLSVLLRKGSPIIFSIAVLAGVVACTVGPDYVRPTVDVPPSFKEADGWKIAQPREAAIGEKWWELFDDHQLNALEEQVMISNQNIAAAEAQFRQARAQVQASRAGYMPTITIGAAASRAKRSGNVDSGQGNTTSDFLLPMDLSWEIDLWGRIRRTVEASQASSQASAADLAAVRLSAQAELALDYFLIRTLDGQKQLLDRTVAIFQKSLDQTRNRYMSGIVAKVDVLQAETQLKGTQAQAIDLDVQRAQLEHAIALLIGKPASDFFLAVVPLDVLPPAIPLGVPSELLERRPDIATAERNVAAANAQIGVAEAAFFPTLKLTASGGFEASSIAKWLAWPSRFWAVGPSVSETLFDGGLRRAQTEQARAAYDATVAIYRQTVLTGFKEVEDNLAALRILEEEARVQEDAVNAARQSVTATTNQYKAGIVSYLNVIITQAAALNNERTAVDILGRRMAASVLLIKALGGGWNVDVLRQSDGAEGSGKGNPQSTDRIPESKRGSKNAQ